MHIQRLSEETRNKIAAGEILQRPSNAIKELVENSIDAGATNITITITDGGLGQMTIKDNGKGIPVEDYPLVCERFATSKIRSYQDLSKIGSFGFRGEALASLSHVCQVHLISKHKDNEAYQASYRNEKILGQPEPHHLDEGTIISCKNLFSSFKGRRQCLKPAEQKSRIVKIVSIFAIHYNSVKFKLICSGQCELATDKNTKIELFSRFFNIPQNDIAAETTKIGQVSLIGLFSKPKCVKGKNVIILVNNRIVEIPLISSAINNAYLQFCKSIHAEDITYVVYLSLDMNPEMIDCNVHPTKNVVHISNCQFLCDKLSQWVLEILRKNSRIPTVDSKGEIKKLVISQSEVEYKKAVRVRTDSKEVPLHYYIPVRREEKVQILKPQIQVIEEKREKEQKSIKQVKIQRTKIQKEDTEELTKKEQQKIQQPQIQVQHPIMQQEPQKSLDKPDAQRIPTLPPAQLPHLSIPPRQPMTLFNKCQQNREVHNFFKNLTYVGCINSNYILVQQAQSLLVLNTYAYLPSLLTMWINKQSSILIRPLNRQIKQLFTKLQQETKLQFNIQSYCIGLIENSEYIYKNLRIKVQENGYITHMCYPFEEVEVVREVDLGYLLARLAKLLMSNCENVKPIMHKYLVEYFACLFEEEFQKYSQKSEQIGRLYRDCLLPLAKIKGQFENIDVRKTTKQMLNLKQVYKLFERC